jgi:hypothetical protein
MLGWLALLVDSDAAKDAEMAQMAEIFPLQVLRDSFIALLGNQPFRGSRSRREIVGSCRRRAGFLDRLNLDRQHPITAHSGDYESRSAAGAELAAGAFPGGDCVRVMIGFRGNGLRPALVGERRASRAAGDRGVGVARARVADKTRDEVREIYPAELNARDLPAPRDTVLDAIVDSISGNPLPAARLATESLVQTGRAVGRLSRRFRPGN